MTPEQVAAVRTTHCLKCGAMAGDDCVDVSVELAASGTRIVTIQADGLGHHRDPHPIRMVHYRRNTDAVTRLGDLIDE